MKLDLWNEVHHTPPIEAVWKNYEATYAVDIAPSLVKWAVKKLKEKIPVKAKVGKKDAQKLKHSRQINTEIYRAQATENRFAGSNRGLCPTRLDLD